MKKLYDKIWEFLPMLWGLFWVGIITIGSISLLILVIKWFLSLVGVM